MEMGREKTESFCFLRGKKSKCDLFCCHIWQSLLRQKLTRCSPILVPIAGHVFPSLPCSYDLANEMFPKVMSLGLNPKIFSEILGSLSHPNLGK